MKRMKRMKRRKEENKKIRKEKTHRIHKRSCCLPRCGRDPRHVRHAAQHSSHVIEPGYDGFFVGCVAQVRGRDDAGVERGRDVETAAGGGAAAEILGDGHCIFF